MANVFHGFLGSDSSPPDDTVLPQEAQPSYQDHFPPPPPPEYGDVPQFPAPDHDFPFEDFVEIPGTPPPQQAPFQPFPPAQPYSCGVCPKSFLEARELTRHMKTHNRPYQCPVPNCSSQGFPSGQGRKRHIEAKHPETVPEAQLWYCPVQTCKYAISGFKRADHFQRHMKQHPGFMW
ncbi:hypothetical protein NA56DRAFT_750138 [Hyaloscypha hepaticicola]|uniref:C2H2-type domain-containing protein n=1 Tax=Hyaloscypha hepaticicola TaxID=2082293 RepID=A0A2J6Q0P1_9HELO|nr:hypothetical protein NA56DRAFT_750138 [Hyaloscypha hepaticicola]